MKKLIRITETDIRHIVENTIRKILVKEDASKEDYDNDLSNHLEGNYDDYLSFLNDKYNEEDTFYRDMDQDPDAYKDDFDGDLSDGDLYRY